MTLIQDYKDAMQNQRISEPEWRRFIAGTLKDAGSASRKEISKPDMLDWDKVSAMLKKEIPEKPI